MRALKYSLLVGAVLTVPVHAFAFGPHYMTRDKSVKANAAWVQSVRPEPGKAALVIGRTTGGMSWGGPRVDAYLEKKMIGETAGKAAFVTRDIAPGTHYLVTKLEKYGFSVVKLNFEADRVYYVMEWFPPLGNMDIHWDIVVVPEEITQKFDEDLRYYVYDGSGADLSEEEYRLAVNQYEAEVAKGEHEEFATYRGAPAPAAPQASEAR